MTATHLSDCTLFPGCGQDLGWWDTQVNGNAAAPTPHIKNMVDMGMRLDRHYVFRYCSPTRRSFLTGRFPNHISNAQAPTCSNYMPLEFTLLSEKLSRGANCKPSAALPQQII